ncbi:MAG TPA: hypothetical protein VLE49_19640 [Anaerolineales bacterium]|nr:hypothetical protein [Anaerolineales bacterium]
MFRSFLRTGGMSVLFRRVSIGILTLVFILDSAGQATPVQAAPARSEIKDIYQVEANVPDPVCAGEDNDLRVRLMLTTQHIEKGKVVFENHSGIGQAKIAAAPAGNVEVNPIFTPLQTSWAASGNNRSGEVTFTVRGTKAGTATVVLDVEREDGKAKTFTVDFTVVNCKYKIKMFYRRVVTGFAVVGKLSTIIKGDGQQFAGSGIMDAKSTVAAVCGVTITDFLGPTDITATSSEDGEQLNLNFKYGSATTTTSVSCPEDTITFSKTQDPTSFLIASAALPSSGGSRTFAAPQGGTITITAQPEAEGAGS